MRTVLALLFTLAPASALAGYGGGGVSLHHTGVLEPVNCLGAMGYGVNDAKVRLGGEANACTGRSVGTTWGGMQFGHQSRPRGLYTAAYAGLGGGWLAVGRDEPSREAGFLYARPTLTLGVPMGLGAVEFSLYGMLDFPVYQRVPANEDPLGVLPSGGAQITLLFGDFRAKKKAKPAPAPPPRRAYAPAPQPRRYYEPPPRRYDSEVLPPPAPGARPPYRAPIQPWDLSPSELTARPLVITEPDQPRPR